MIHLPAASPGVTSRQIVFKNGDSQVVSAESLSLDYDSETVLEVNDITGYHFQKVWPGTEPVGPAEQVVDVPVPQPVEVVPAAEPVIEAPQPVVPTESPVVDIPAVQPVVDPLAAYFAPQDPPAT